MGSAIALLLYFSTLIALPFLYIWGAWRFGGWAESKTQRRYFRLLFTAIAIVAPATWVAVSAVTFKRACSTAKLAEVYSKAPEPQVSFFFDADSLRRLSPQKGTSIPRRLVEKGAFQFYEESYSAGRSPQYARRFSAKLENSNIVESKYAFESLEPQRYSAWWKPPIYTVKYVVRELSSDRILADGEELVFGGGMIGTYMRAFNGGQDFEFLSCGYASNGIAAWRPNNTSNPRHRQYLAADSKIIVGTLGP